MSIQLVLLLLGAYLLGSIPTAYLMARWRRGIDIRRFGSGNIGASNAVATGSKLTTITVFAVDFLKGASLVFVAKEFLHLPVYQQVAVGVAAICGHNWTLFLRFSGGRGVLTTLGVIFALEPWLATVLLALNLLWMPFKQFALGTLFVLVLMPFLSWFLAGFFRIDQPLSLSLGLAAILLVLMLRRLTAPRNELGTTVPVKELLVNRLLFDRDIRDRKAWLRRGAAGAK